MNIKKFENGLSVTLHRDFNLNAVIAIKNHLSDDVQILTMDLGPCKLVDSEAIIFLDRWIRSGKKLQLSEPPDIFDEIVVLLRLDQIWNLPEILDKKTDSHF